ncbi:MAG TPA: phenylalanine--tRNA ligase subunit alpha [Chthonomonadales bacterium]|nr:phenylalanine--tRNA ligase subunit alpha [Chthonomonadales bacterium]
MDELEQLVVQAEREAAEASSVSEVATIEARYLGGKGSLQAQLRLIGSLLRENRPTFGARVNAARDRLAAALAERRQALAAAEAARRLERERIDVTLPGHPFPAGGEHPLSQTEARIKAALVGLGFEFAEGVELEDYAHNFAALNYPPEHPAFDEQMTFYVDDTRLLRTQTTAIQGRLMPRRPPPFRYAVVGRCFRYEAVDATHHHTFHQVDAFMVDRGIGMADLKGVLRQFASTMFGGDVMVRFRPDFFPFVEPGVDYSILWQGRWLELGGAGLVHPNILEAHDIDSETYSGFAFGLGVERIHMIQNGVADLRLYLDNDFRFLSQF